MIFVLLKIDFRRFSGNCIIDKPQGNIFFNCNFPTHFILRDKAETALRIFYALKRYDAEGSFYFKLVPPKQSSPGLVIPDPGGGGFRKHTIDKTIPAVIPA